MKRLFLILALAVLFTSFSPARAQDGNVLQSVTGCLDLSGYQGYIIHAPLNLAPGEPAYWITPTGYVRQRLGPPVSGLIRDDSLLTLQGYNGWYGYDDVRYARSFQIATLEVHSASGIQYLDIWQSLDAVWVFVLDDLYWYAAAGGLQIYTYTEIVALWEGTFGDDALWTSYHWGVHPDGCTIDGLVNSGVFTVNPAELPDEIQAFIE